MPSLSFRLDLCVGPAPDAPALCLVLGCMIFPDGWDAETIRDMCGAKTGKYSLGDCSVRWAYILAIIGILNALILSFLAFVLGNRQTDLLQEELKQENKGKCVHRGPGLLRAGKATADEIKGVKQKLHAGSWSDSLADQSTGCSSRGPGLIPNIHVRPS